MEEGTMDVVDTPSRSDKTEESKLPDGLDVSNFLKEKVMKFLRSGRHKAYTVFKDPVDPATAPNYHVFIDRPMDMGKIREKACGGQYKELNEFFRDFSQMTSNSYVYNRPGTQVAELTKDYELTMIRRVSSQLELVVEGTTSSQDSIMDTPSVHSASTCTNNSEPRRTLRMRHTIPIPVHLGTSETGAKPEEFSTIDEDSDVEKLATKKDDQKTPGTINERYKQSLLTIIDDANRCQARLEERKDQLKKLMDMHQKELSDIKDEEAHNKKKLKDATGELRKSFPGVTVPSAQLSKKAPRKRKLVKQPNSSKSTSHRQQHGAPGPSNAESSDDQNDQISETPTKNKKRKSSLPAKKLKFQSEATGQLVIDKTKPLPDDLFNTVISSLQKLSESDHDVFRNIMETLLNAGLTVEDGDIDLSKLTVNKQWEIYEDVMAASSSLDHKTNANSNQDDKTPMMEPTSPAPNGSQELQNVQLEPQVSSKPIADSDSDVDLDVC